MTTNENSQGAPAPIELPPLPEPLLEGVDHELWGQNVTSDVWDAQQLQDYARTHEANVCAAIGGEVERLRNALARVVDTDWAYLGHDADTANPDSLYNRVRDGRKALGGAR